MLLFLFNLFACSALDFPTGPKEFVSFPSKDKTNVIIIRRSMIEKIKQKKDDACCSSVFLRTTERVSFASRQTVGCTPDECLKLLEE